MNKINEEGFIINKKRNNEWLGYGIYMFLYKIDAITWGKGTYYCKDDPAIIKCVLEVEKDKYLDLDNPEEKNNYEEYFREILILLSENGKTLEFKDKYEAMCWGLNIYKKDKQVDLIQYTFRNKRTKNFMKYGNMELGYDYNEVQMCATANYVIIKKEIC